MPPAHSGPPSELTRPGPLRQGFTLIELMVVIVILGLLAAVLLPVVGNIEAQGRAVGELSCARTAISGWRDYAMDRRGELLKGYYPDSDPSTDPLFDFNGNQIGDGEPQRRWFWRLAPYIDTPKETFFPQALNEVRRQLIDVPDHQYAATLHPGFGLNGEWIGGLGEDLANNLWALYEYGDLDQCPWSQRLSNIHNPSRLIVFATSRFGDTAGGGDGSNTWMPGITEGFHRIQSPCHPTNGMQWKTTDEGSVFDTMTNDPADHGFVSARHGGKVVTAMVDGSTALERLSTIADMRRWSDQAWKRDWVLVE